MPFSDFRTCAFDVSYIESCTHTGKEPQGRTDFRFDSDFLCVSGPLGQIVYFATSRFVSYLVGRGKAGEKRPFGAGTCIKLMSSTLA